MLDENFKMVKVRVTPRTQKVVTVLRARFNDALFSDGKYTDRYNLDKTTFSKLMIGRVTGKNVKNESSTVGKIIKQLKSDGIWIGELPWENRASREV